MKNLILFVAFVCITSYVNAQNVGQEGDTLLNYTDINGLKQGHWNKKYENGTLQYEGYFIDGKPVGDFKRYDKRGDLYAYLKHEANSDLARSVFYHSNGKPSATGNYIGKLKDSIWNYYDDGGILYLQESFKNGVNHGTFRKYTSEKILFDEVNWKDGVKDGSWRKFYTSGELMWQSTYVNGKLEGDAKSYFQSGQVYKEGVYRADLMEGPWKTYNENGNLEKIYQYKNGVSPEADAENEEMMRELENNKNQFDGPANSNDIDWLRGGKE